MDIIRLFKDYNVPYKTEGHKHCREGWVNIPCPFCTGNAGYHLGFDLQEEYFVCWRCGGHSIKNTLLALLRIPRQELTEILRRYKYTNLQNSALTTAVNKKINIKPFKLPSGIVDELPKPHKLYLESRNFDAKYLWEKYDLRATKMISKLDNLDFKWRIIVPIYWENKMVNFLGRAINPNEQQRYMVCPEEREILNIKNTLYGESKNWANGFGIGVEGVTDVWRLQGPACAVYGIKYKPVQVRMISKMFKRFPVLFDEDPQAIIQAKKLVAALQIRGVESWSVKIKGDPGSMSDSDAQALVRELQTYKIK